MPKPLGTHVRPAQEETREFINFETSIQVFLSGRPSGTRKWKLKLSAYVHLELRTKFGCPDSPSIQKYDSIQVDKIFLAKSVNPSFITCSTFLVLTTRF
jgi:hypothetical protein